ncbi:RagB/SusD family nutrient uptake outer membrane protein [Flavobacterium sp.]|uniref:RagB/SusD family nutrient uptake outer membrane protein n=1 Tax=Flavobacterium sp. TaxID=239 RepID=UPI002D1A1805|nr:RagB/SusD family nutrient uptake outer membrane protein [Flavobacterium sp.]HSD05766.1 RagB/SusD family nutrient uptake outer membrane protein [Flavobacterium sp.]
MKNIRILLFAISLGLASCASLDEDPKSFISPDQFYKTANDAIAAVNAIYYHLNQNDTSAQPIYNPLYYTGLDFMSDDVSPGPGATNPDARSLGALTHSASLIRGAESWQQHYAAINMANAAIERIPGIAMDEKLKSRLLGEARFLRALYYFNIVRQFGDVPLVLTDQTQLPIDELQVQRAPANEVYAQIITDLKESVNSFKNGSAPEVGRATEGAAKSLLSKVYLTKRDWANAVATAEEVINGSYGYTLLSDYSQVFLPAYKNSSEHIFSIQFNTAANLSNALTNRAIATGIPGLKGVYADMVPFYTKGTDKYFSIYKLYTPKDKRRNVSFVTKFKSPTNGKWYGKLYDAKVPGDSIPYFNKYWDPNYASTGKSEANANIIRFAEILLIHSEAENELNGPTAKAYASLNRIRKRAGLADLTPGLTKDQFREAVYLDRRLELVGEYQRTFDLIREIGSEVTGVGPEGRGTLLKNLQEAGKTNVAAKHYLFPIPQVEIERNKKLTQNPGWE